MNFWDTPEYAAERANQQSLAAAESRRVQGGFARGRAAAQQEILRSQSALGRASGGGYRPQPAGPPLGQKQLAAPSGWGLPSAGGFGQTAKYPPGLSVLGRAAGWAYPRAAVAQGSFGRKMGTI